MPRGRTRPDAARTRGQRRPCRVAESGRVRLRCGSSGAASVLPSVQQVIERHNLRPENLGKMDQLSLELQLENGTSYAMLSEEIEEKTHELRKIRGEEPPGMDIEELQKLEKELEGERFLQEINALQQKGAQLMGENQRLKQMENLFSTQTHVLEQGQSSESITNICSSSYPQDNDSSDISLKLGLPFPK
nr:mads-box protein svp [Quercus suber]